MVDATDFRWTLYNTRLRVIIKLGAGPTTVEKCYSVAYGSSRLEDWEERSS